MPVELVGQPSAEFDHTKLDGILQAVGDFFGERRSAEVSLHFVTVGEMTALNESALKHTGATDVLSFPLLDVPGAPVRQLGDIFVCSAVAAEQNEPMLFLFHHGLLHLFGLDHHTDPAGWEAAYKQTVQSLPTEDIARLPGAVSATGFEA